MAEIKNTIEDKEGTGRKEKDFEREQKLNKLIDLRKELTGKPGDEFEKAVDRLKDKISIEHEGVFEDYELYWVLVDEKSESKCIPFDFEGDCSVEKFLEEWANKRSEIEPEEKAA